MQYLTKLRTFAEKLHDTLFWKNVLQFGIKENNRDWSEISGTEKLKMQKD